MRNLALVCVLGAFLYGCSDASDSTAVIPLALTCDEQQTVCSQSIRLADRDLRWTLGLQDPLLPAMQALSFHLDARTNGTGNEAPVAVPFTVESAWIEGKDMFMGEHVLSSSLAHQGEYLLEGMIPVCITGSEMVWRVIINLDVEGAHVQAFADLRSLAH